jgi:hypothetical protein
VSNDDVRAELEKVLTNGCLTEEERLALRSLVEQNAVVDESVRNPLRSRLDEYYAGAGKDDIVVIELPEGAGSPVFRSKAAIAGYQPSVGRKLFMFALCLISLIAVWVWFWFGNK